MNIQPSHEDLIVEAYAGGEDPKAISARFGMELSEIEALVRRMTYPGGTVLAPMPHPSGSNLPPVTCPHGHAAPTGSTFCPSCGTPMAVVSGPRKGARRKGGPPLLKIGIASGVVALLVVGLVAWFTGRGSSPAASGVTTVSGTLSLFDFATKMAGCATSGGYSDIGSGAQVVITDEAGKVLGAGSLGSPSPMLTGTCAFPFSIPGIPTDENQYVVECGTRGKVVFSRADMVANGWNVVLSLGHGD
jgi:hypothetical protein